MDNLLRLLVENKASDLHIKTMRPPLLRKAGKLLPIDNMAELTPAITKELIYSIMTEDQRRIFERLWEADFSYSIAGVARFRINVLKQRGSIGAVIRLVPYDIPTIDEANLPAVIKKIAMYKQGLILVTGPTGCGKSTTLAAMINHINSIRNCHIITVEDPIEFLHKDKFSVINQREVGVDTHSFREALRRALRQDPEVILIGEMRDLETISTAITAAETGHLVLSTLHTNDAIQTIDRIIDIFPAQAQNQIRIQLALTLRAIISQKLLNKIDGSGRIPAVEIMINSPIIKKKIEEGRTSDILKIIEDSRTYWNMQSLNQALAELVNKKYVTPEEAKSASPNPADLDLKLRGVFGGEMIMIE